VMIDDIQSDSAPRSVILRKAVKAVALSDDGTRALVLHAPVTGVSGQAEDVRIDASEGYSVVDTVSGFAKLQLTSAALRERDLLITPDGARLFALLRDDVRGVRAVDMIDLSSFQVSSLALGKPPTSIGFLPGLSRVFVGQAGEGGLITFLDAQTGTRLRDVSGFEIASRIRQ
jgi:DNA-binding beta-propeller fold protein YncE